MAKQERVAVLGASDNPERYSNKAVRLLLEHGHRVIPIHPRLKEVEGLTVVENLEALASRPGSLDTITIYVNAGLSAGMENAIVACAPERVIFNPGTENGVLKEKLVKRGIEVVENCTLVMLQLGQY